MYSPKYDLISVELRRFSTVNRTHDKTADLGVSVKLGEEGLRLHVRADLKKAIE